MPRFSLFVEGSGELLVLHLIIELFSVFVALLVVVLAWNVFTEEEGPASRALIFGFTVVAGLDLLHAVSYPGMPDLFSPASTPKAIFFWFLARAFDLLTFCLLALGVRLPGQRWHWLVAALGTLAVVFAWGTWRLDLFPVTYVPGEGATTLNGQIDMVLMAGYWAAGWVFASSAPKERNRYLAWACFLMGLAQLMLNGFFDTGDVLLFLGHLLKISAFALIFMATFLLGLRSPYQLLQRSEQQVRSKQAELDTLLTRIPAGLARIDSAGHYVYVNARLASRLGQAVESIVGRPFGEIVKPERNGTVSHHFELALSGQSTGYEGQTYLVNGEANHATVWMAPEHDSAGQVVGVIAVVLDVTEQRRLQQDLAHSMHEVSELKAALDAHAIVAITNAQGIITSVNDKFCEISQYSREELLGRSHRVINSGHHSEGFFQDLWHTISGGNVWTGEICNRAKNGSLYWVHTTIVPFVGKDGLAEQYIAIRADITKRKQAEQDAQRMALHDALTDLPNRRLMAERLSQAVVHAVRDKHMGALLLLDLDLDHFKEINDTLGHALGDDLLRAVANRLRTSVRQTDTVARLGGDEFVVVLTDVASDMAAATAAASDWAEKVRVRLAYPYEVHGEPVITTSSVGVVLFGSAADDPEEMLKQADMALYKAKAGGRNQVCFFDPSLQADVNSRASLLRDLRVAVEQHQLRLYYQPVVDRARRVLGVEALVRWVHPQRGLVSPAAFIPLAEQSGIILQIGEWVLDTACAQLRAWSDDPVRTAWTVAVNVSARQFNEPTFVATVESALARAGANPTRLRLELTESLLQADLDSTIHKMRLLTDAGVHFSLDDFGTGYSSLSYLKLLPLDQFKIDKSFVNDILNNRKDLAIAKTILGLASNLGLGVVAEGVENVAQYELLEAYGCEAFQGYLFSKPVPAQELPQQAFI
ncbi:MAG: EAL domain-containing protein [Hydrogenophaga sp.]|nr:EAL domain-containing protein [Hydrogenophaga sp.]